jgi:hypothetical protein
MTATSSRALYRPDDQVQAWVAVEIFERRANGDVVCRELNRVLPGVWVARSWQVAMGDNA